MTSEVITIIITYNVKYVRKNTFLISSTNCERFIMRDINCRQQSSICYIFNVATCFKRKGPFLRHVCKLYEAKCIKFNYI
jgi:hypothetical protein